MATGALMLDLVGTSLTTEEAITLQHPEVGGLILFSRNYTDPVQLHELMRSVRSIRPDLIVAVDQEGGRVQRFREGFTRLPPMAVLGQLYQQDPVTACTSARELGWLMAAELRAFDIDISFAPVLDIDWQQSSIIGDRAFASEPEALAALAIAFMQGMHEAGMAATGKHFPGHGWVQADSHLELPVDERDETCLEQSDIQPFKALIAAGLDAIMPAHVVYSQVDPQPAGFSQYWLKEKLRKQLGFSGVIFSDDLTMEGASIAGNYAERCRKALAAGCDMVLVCNQPVHALEVLDYLKSQVAIVNPRIAKMRGRPDDSFLNSQRFKQARELAGRCMALIG
ncbi:beta-hexosaminidase [Nitrincola sp. A-D6]|uniref:beta-N-acetylhexosaminidase n=1 Tax=Nitrincola sp. A-D6 TaxID=1545442 RepID=UPI00051FB5BD|nr:beta-N-acetylhexosaminidase [Nitrincola sp. A-D6]KGK41582.1 beta-hexosaminidase [Nitrincola sp. A-D6]